MKTVSALPVSTDARWYQLAACKGVDLVDFFLKSKESEVLGICYNCPVMAECRTAGDVEEKIYGQYVWGVRGGETADDRRNRRRTSIRIG